MTDLIWFNGKTMPMSEARIGVEDRGYQFADGVYEVIRIYAGRTFTLREHLERLERSARDILMQLPLDVAQLAGEIEDFVEKTGLHDGMVYLQLTRGCAPRNHVIPDCKPTLLFYTRPLPAMQPAGTGEGVKLKSVVDERWKRCWIKSIALLPNVLAKSAAVSAGADEAIFVDEGVVTECSASNVYAVIEGAVMTHPVGPKVLPGITRQILLELAPTVGVKMVERAISLDALRRAQEVFITSTTREINWVSTVDETHVARTCGEVTLRLHRALQDRIVAETR